MFADETKWWLMRRGGSERWFTWEIASLDAVFYLLSPDRSNETARQLLGEYRGTVMADGYGVYESLSEQGMRYKLANCWAHVKSKFEAAQENFPQAREMLDLIRELYQVEHQVPPIRPWTPEVERAEILALRERLRREQSKPIVDRIRNWLYRTSQEVLPESGLGQAIRYTLNRWYGLTAFLKEARLPLDNNAAERGMRGVVLGRRNFNGSRSRRGTEVAAVFYSLVESAKLCGLDPKDYLLRAARAAITDGTVLLPHELMRAS